MKRIWPELLKWRENLEREFWSRNPRRLPVRDDIALRKRLKERKKELVAMIEHAEEEVLELRERIDANQQEILKEAQKYLKSWKRWGKFERYKPRGAESISGRRRW